MQAIQSEWEAVRLGGLTGNGERVQGSGIGTAPRPRAEVAMGSCSARAPPIPIETVIAPYRGSSDAGFADSYLHMAE